MLKMQILEKWLYFGLYECKFALSLSCSLTTFYFIDLPDYLILSEPSFKIKAFGLSDKIILIDLPNKIVKTIEKNVEIVFSIFGTEVEELKFGETGLLDAVLEMQSDNEEKWCVLQ